MLRVCLLLPILLLAGAPLSRAQEEDQEVREKNILRPITLLQVFVGFKNWQNLDTSPPGLMVPGHDGVQAGEP